MAVQSVALQPISSTSFLSRRMRRFLPVAGVTLLATLLLTIYLSPLVYMLVTSLESPEQRNLVGAPVLYPANYAFYEYQGKDYPLYSVPIDGGIQVWALFKKGREQSQFIDPNNLDAGPIEWVGRWRTLDPVWRVDSHPENFGEAWDRLDFLRLFRNTFAIAAIGDVGTLISSVLVAYGFSRFRLPGKNTLFMILIGTIILPGFVTFIPTYALFVRIGWNQTWLPLTVPHFFANAYNVFLLRQYFMTIPREMDEAAMIDGASPLRTLLSVILPQAIPGVVAVALFHFYFAWNDFFGPLVYLSQRPDLQPISVGLTQFTFRYGFEPHLVQAGAILALILPVVIFIFTQRIFIQGVVITGVEK